MQSLNPDVIVPVSGRHEEAECSRAGTDITRPADENSDESEVPESARHSEKEAYPEKKIILWAVALAFLEKGVCGLRTLNFIWATVVLLGGFAQTLKNIDFWFVTAILMAEGVRLFSRRGELAVEVATQWSDYTSTPFSRRGKVVTLGKVVAEVSTQLSKYAPILLMKIYSSVMQFYSASTCVTLSIFRLQSQHYGGIHNENRDRALNIFYGLSLAEGILILLGFLSKEHVVSDDELLPLNSLLGPLKSRLRYRRMDLVSKVTREYGLEKCKWTIRRFFYRTYSQCIYGSVLDGLKMEFVPYCLELLQSTDRNEQLMAARTLSMLVKNDRFALETSNAIGAMPGVVEKLIKMLNRENPKSEDIRKEAAEIICKFLVHGGWNSIQVMTIAGSIESIASSLYDSDQIEIHSGQYPNQSVEYDYAGITKLGLEILKRLADNHDNCAKIGTNRKLLPRIIGLAELNPNKHESQIEMTKLARQLIGMLASSPGSTEKRIWELVFARDVLNNGEIWTHGIQILAIDTLTSLAGEPYYREIIGRTHGVLPNLLSLFFMEGINSNEDERGDLETKAVTKAGEALSFLSLENKQNCQIMMRYHPNWIADLINVLNDPVQGIVAARILRNMLACGEADCDDSMKLIIEKAAQIVVSHVMEKQGAPQEAAIGLAAQIFGLMAKLEIDPVNIERRLLISKLLEDLRRHQLPSEEVPSITIFSIELLISVIMEMDRSAITLEMKSGLEEVMEEMMKTTSGAVGLSSQRMAIRWLVHSAMVLLRN